MTEHLNSRETRSRILDEFYQNVYHKYLFEKDIQGAGVSYFEKAVEKFWCIESPTNVLELGGGNGEHLKFLKYIPNGKYVSFDLRAPHMSLHETELPKKLIKKIVNMQGMAEKLPFPDQSFDRVYSTCLLHHVDDVLAVLMEARRVSSIGAELAFLIPTDPGFLNQLVKRTISYPKMRKLSKIKPELFYALDHKNHFASILELIKFVFADDRVKLHYRPFRFKSWNLNLLVVARITKLTN